MSYGRSKENHEDECPCWDQCHDPDGPCGSHGPPNYCPPCECDKIRAHKIKKMILKIIDDEIEYVGPRWTTEVRESLQRVRMKLVNLRLKGKIG